VSQVWPPQTNKLDNFVPPYRTVTYSTPPIPPMGTRIPRPVLDSYFNKFGTPERVPRAEPRKTPVILCEECLAVIREDFKKSMSETFGVELSSKSRVYQKSYLSYFDSVPYPMGWHILDFVKFNGENNKTTWEHVSQYLA
jgi:hypothetical protein